MCPSECTQHRCTAAWVVCLNHDPQAELEKAVKEKAVERRRGVFEKTKEEVAKRVKFEDAVSVMWSVVVILKFSFSSSTVYFSIFALD